jgi:ABC-2 type transport system permease protein
MSLTLFTTTFRKNWILLLIFFGVLAMYVIVMISMYNPEDIESLLSLLKVFSEDFIKAFGFSGAVTDLTTYLASWLYGMLMFALPMVYSIILGNRLVAKTVDNGSMAYLLSTPNSRNKIIITLGIYALISVLVLFIGIFALGVISSNIMFPGLLNVNGFLRLNFTTLLVNMAVLMIVFFFSCLFNESRYSLLFGAGIPIIFLLMNMLGGTAEAAKIFKQISIYGLYDPVNVAKGGETLGINLFFTCVIAILFIASVIIFKRKRLPL